MRTMNHVAVAGQSRLEQRSAWLMATGAFTGSVVALLIIYWATAISLVSTWARSGMFQYAFLIFPISLWLVWNKREELVASHRPSVCLPAALLLCGTGFIWLLGYLANVNLLQHIALIASFPVLTLIFFGWPTVKMLVFPLAYLVFAIPAGHSLVGHFQTITAVFSVKALQLTGVPVLLQAHHITTPATVWKVAQACSGIKFFLACTALGCLFAYLMFESAWRRIGFTLVSMIVPVIANGLRVYFTILIGETFGVKYASGTDHLIFGWQFFGTVLFLLFLGGWFLRQPAKPPAEDGKATSTGRDSWRYMSVALVGVLAVLVATPVIAGLIKNRATSAAERVNFTAPAARAGWAGPVRSTTLWRPDFRGADRILDVGYTRANQKVALYTAIYSGVPVTGHDLLAYRNSLFNPDRWSGEKHGTSKVVLAHGSVLKIHKLVMSRPLRARLLWYWYQINKHTLASPVQVKARQAWEQLAGKPLISSVVAVSAPFKGGHQKGARATLTRFVRDFYSRLKYIGAPVTARTTKDDSAR